ncbi:hypothetical protein N4T20_02235 [Flavobacterium sp. TR2]|uniref:hypothetical protein n=1 Tax=Flavobacterium sp. TR2 TaxID=2977321 RepID=UPI0021B1577E|nr:hypothetical protein [Flavobacterium sp. TR2]UWY28753.1 hypothetical protein N4T20_02235 [Flavobacterium sp. TR2]
MNQQPNRIEQLNIVLQYCSEKNKVFTRGERICINQERGYLLGLSFPSSEATQVFQHSELLQYKISQTLKEIKYTGWNPDKEIEINWSTDAL